MAITVGLAGERDRRFFPRGILSIPVNDYGRRLRWTSYSAFILLFRPLVFRLNPRPIYLFPNRGHSANAPRSHAYDQGSLKRPDHGQPRRSIPPVPPV